MPGRMITPLNVVDAQIKAAMESKMRVLMNILCLVGEKCIIEARTGGTYTDQTGNLRSSIGYAVVSGSEIVKEDYIGKIKNGSEGVSAGLAYLQSKAEEAKKANKGLTLIVTAGMHYAEYVEAKGYVVLSSAEEMADKLVRELLTKLGFKVK